MADEIIALMPQGENLVFVDATAGGGGHLARLAERAGNLGQVFAFDKDPRAHQEDASLGVAKSFANIKLFHANFSQVSQILHEQNINHIDGLICDLGVSSHQLDEASRGFSFQKEGPLDMRMNTSAGISAYEWLERTREDNIADILYKYGGERKSRVIARAIKNSWPLENSTLALARLVTSAMRQKKWSKIHPATRTFQAIRMAVNHELDELEALLEQAPKLLNIGGVLAFLSFHSGEDRLIKHEFKKLALQKNYILINKKPIIASEEEIKHNSRARSAKLRAIKRVA